MKAEELSNLDRIALEKALKETPGLRVGGSVPRSVNKGYSDLPLFKTNSQISIFDGKKNTPHASGQGSGDSKKAKEVNEADSNAIVGQNRNKPGNDHPY